MNLSWREIFGVGRWWEMVRPEQKSRHRSYTRTPKWMKKRHNRMRNKTAKKSRNRNRR